jgi:hypothetical protein
VITPINPNIHFDCYELHNYIDNILVYLVTKSFTRNTKLLSIPNDENGDYMKFHIRQLISTGHAIDLNEARLAITNNLINSFKQAHND